MLRGNLIDLPLFKSLCQASIQRLKIQEECRDFYEAKKSN